MNLDGCAEKPMEVRSGQDKTIDSSLVIPVSSNVTGVTSGLTLTSLTEIQEIPSFLRLDGFSIILLFDILWRRALRIRPREIKAALASHFKIPSTEGSISRGHPGTPSVLVRPFRPMLGQPVGSVEKDGRMYWPSHRPSSAHAKSQIPNTLQ